MTKITKIYNNARKIPYDKSSKFVMMSDIHRGVGSKADDFTKNKKVYFQVLEQYYKNNFTYIELGDGEELWENRSLKKIIQANLKIYLLLKKFYKQKRLYFIYGNHDKVKQNQKYVRENLYKYYDQDSNSYKDLFAGLKMYEGLILESTEYKGDILLIHGHQIDFINDKLWLVARFLSRYLWKPMEYLGIQDPTRPAKAQNKKLSVEKKLTEWIIDNKHMLIAGHTHKAIFSDFDVPPYFNDGCCVRKKKITAIEIEKGMISLVKWRYETKEGKTKELKKTILEGPMELKKYFEYKNVNNNL